MQVCKNCGAEIKYIATTHNKSIACDSEEITIYTMTGRKVSGYKLHQCKKEKENEK